MRTSRSNSDASTHSVKDTSPSIPIFVKLPSGETVPMTLPTSTTTATLSHLISLRTSLSPSSFRLTHHGKHITTAPTSSSTFNDTPPTLSTLNLPPNALLAVTLPIRGGMPPKKQRCTFKDCKDFSQRIVGDCGFCSGHFCGKHRMLEDHKCSGLEDCKKESHERNAVKLESERTTVIRGI